MTNTQESIDRIARLPEVAKITGLSASTIRSYIRSGVFPAPFPLGRRGIGWKISTITNWIEARLQERLDDAARAIRRQRPQRRNDVGDARQQEADGA
jgi:prophage regulatory protein